MRDPSGQGGCAMRRETGIRNTFHTLHRNGLTRGQIMEIVMYETDT